MSDGIPPAGPPQLLAPPVLMIDNEGTQQAFAILAEQLRAFVDALRPLAQQMMLDVSAVCRTFAAMVETADMGELADARRRARSRVKSNYARRRRRRARRR